MNSPNDSALAVIAALLVLFTAMLDPRVSSALAVGLLIAFAIYKWIDHRAHKV